MPHDHYDTPHKVHIGFGFHVNCYHSYRGDTPDELGFGSDIRIIRHIIRVLDQWNSAGVPVKGTWDFENAYSLEEILPRHAPDIIEHVRRRQRDHGDENILMGYNNGAMSAMTEREFLTSIELAVSNEKGSGLRDLFGQFAPVIRPQEVMFTPSQAAAYQKAGIKAVCLYYSCVPFDSFRTIIPQLRDESAFNPLRYRYQSGEITILPTYSHSDVMDAGSLRWLVTDLHQQQVSGSIRNDVFVFINLDADSFLWEPVNLPAPLNRIPNANGLDGWIREIADLPFICFNTPGRYLSDHPPVQDIFFGQDTADGNFSGYSSWAEKPFNRQIFTRLERARRMEQVFGENPREFEKRIRLLSTTHFGLASPVLNIARERTALSLSQAMLEDSQCAGDPSELLLSSHKPQTIFCAQLALRRGFCSDITMLRVTAKHLKTYTAISMGQHEDGSISSIYLCCTLSVPMQELSIHLDHHGCFRQAEICADTLSVSIHPQTGTPVIMHQEQILSVCESFLTYRNQRIPFDPPAISSLPVAGQGHGTRFRGAIHLPGEETAGEYTFDFFHAEGIDSLFVRSFVQYPYTPESHEISTQASNLGRFTDNDWQEVCPLSFPLILDDSACVIKRNFMNDISSFPLSDFWNAFPKNANIDAFNHQLTGGILAVQDDSAGLVIAHGRSVLGSMAHCPMRLRTENGKRIVTMNPFGAYYGQQRHYPTRGNGCVMDLYNATMPQAQSLAPAYNGVCEQSIQALQWSGNASFDVLTAIADGVIARGGSEVSAYTGDNVSFPITKVTKSAKKFLPATSATASKWHILLRGGLGLLQTMRRARRKLKRANRSTHKAGGRNK